MGNVTFGITWCYCKKDGTVVKVNVGDKPGDPVFGVSDLLIHLSGEQLEKKAAKVIEGENLDLLIGSIPMQTEDEKVKRKSESKYHESFIQRIWYRGGRFPFRRDRGGSGRRSKRLRL